MTGAIAVGVDVTDLATPVVVIERDVLHRNIAEMAAYASGLGIALRPHWKTTKSAQAARLQLKAGAAGLTAATSAEVLALSELDVPSVFWAYPPVGKERVRAAIDAAMRTDLIVGTDSVEAVAALAEAAASAGIVITVRLDIDSGLGRTGVAPERALAVARELGSMAGLRLDGVWTHEGHVQGMGAHPDLRYQSGLAAGRLVVQVAEAIRADGIDLTTVSVGSTPGVRSAPTIAGVTEARPGTYVLGDENQVAIGTISPDDVAVSVYSRVVSTEPSGWAIIDAGIKAMSSDGSMHGDGRIGTVVSAGGGVVSTGHEEHGFLRDAEDPAVGDIVRIRPNHACGVINMHSAVAVAHEGVVVDVWRTLARH